MKTIMVILVMLVISFTITQPVCAQESDTALLTPFEIKSLAEDAKLEAMVKFEEVATYLDAPSKLKEIDSLVIKQLKKFGIEILTSEFTGSPNQLNKLKNFYIYNKRIIQGGLTDEEVPLCNRYEYYVVKE